ncbi:MAG: peptidase S41 [Phycisphaerales bacterium]|nr:MAG: peptidase S41 [Phycisphaerales bacterium]
MRNRSKRTPETKPRHRRTLRAVTHVVALAGLAAVAHAQVKPHGGMIRYPDVSRDLIVFSYANDLWTVPKSGGVATPLASPPGPELFPRFSPDGQTIAFVGNYDGGRDIYTMPVSGGIPTRVTHHPAAEWLTGWTPDGKILYFKAGLAGMTRKTQLFTVDPQGGMFEQLPPAYGAMGAVSPDGKRLAFTQHTTDNRTWKRYQGGMATHIWVMDLETLEAEQVTNWDGTDTQPMWHGDRLYYLSDEGPQKRLNIWSIDMRNGQRRQVTTHDHHDVKWPSIGPGSRGEGEIVYQLGPELRLLNLRSNRSQAVDVTIPGARPQIRPRTVDASNHVQGWGISSTGQRAVFEARGDIWTVPVETGTPRNLTRTSGAAERDPAWSPDGRWIAYFSDETGEYELYVRQSDGRGAARQLTSDHETYFFDPTWSPNSEHIVYNDKAGKIRLTTVESGETTQIDRDPWAYRPRYSWSHDSNWIAYSKNSENGLGAIWLYDVVAGEAHQVTGDMFNDSSPTFDRKGDFLYYVSTRDFTSPIYEDVGSTFVYAGLDRVIAVPLRDDVENPFAVKIDEETWKDEDEKDEDKDDAEENGDNGENGEDAENGENSANGEDADNGDDAEADSEAERLRIDLDGFERRAMMLPIDRGTHRGLSVNDKHQLIYMTGPARGMQGSWSIHVFDIHAKPSDRKPEQVIDNAGSYAMTADGKKLMVALGGNRYAVIDAAKGQRADTVVRASNMEVQINPREEWAQLVRDAWRRHRDFFYVENMHNVDWDGVYDTYSAMLQDATSREDVSFIIAEMISELNVGHAYYWGGDVEPEPARNVGLLGADFELHDGAYRIVRIYEGAAWDVDARGPLSQPGVNVREGDYLLAVDGVEIDTSKDVYAAFLGLAGRPVALTFSDRPELDADGTNERRVVVEPMRSEASLRYRAWVEDNRRLVEEATDGRVGYVHVPDTGINGQNELFRQFFGQTQTEALVVDERWNGGGQLPNRFIELLNRPRTNYFARRDGKDWPVPADSHQGPKAMLINGLAGSGGDMFPYLFRFHNLGKLIGTRTWGGLVGITGMPPLIDGGYTAVPTFGFYETDGTWGVEGYGVAPDIEVVDHPTALAKGEDPQLQAAIEHLLEELEAGKGYNRAERPADPDRRGMGLSDERDR